MLCFLPFDVIIRERGPVARIGEESQSSLENNLKEEIADVIAMTLLFAKNRGVDVEQALRDKWFKYL